MAALAVAGTLFAKRASFLWRLVRAAKPTERFDDVAGRVKNEALIVLGQKKLFQRLLPGVMHALIFWGFLVLFPTIVMAMVAAVNRDWSIPWLGSQGWFQNLVGAQKTYQNRNQFGGRLGGPIKQNKAFFFILIDEQRYVEKQNVTSLVFTGLLKA